MSHQLPSNCLALYLYLSVNHLWCEVSVQIYEEFWIILKVIRLLNIFLAKTWTIIKK